MSITLRITFKEEVSDHNGYCSGEECELYTQIYKKVVEVDTKEITNNLQYYRKYANAIDVGGMGGSYSCRVSDEVTKSGLNRHDVRISVLKVKLVETLK